MSLVSRIGSGTSDGSYFDLEEWAFSHRFLESLTLTRSTLSGHPEPFKVLPFQSKLVQLFAWKNPDDFRRIRKVYLGVARKNTKTQTAAAISLKLLTCDSEQSPEIYMAAKALEQAEQCYRAAKEMVEASEELSDLLKVVDYKKTITNPSNGGLLRALSAEGKSKHGSNPSAVIFDELHVWGPAEEELYAALTTGSVARRQPLFLFITTAGNDTNSLCYREYTYAKQVQDGTIVDPTYLPLIYEIPEGADWTDESLWPLANPALGHVIQIDALREQFKRAKEQPSYQNTVRRLHGNQWTEQETAWISVADWDACRRPKPDLAGRECYAGLDLSSTTDLTSLVLLYPYEDGFWIEPYFWVPADNLRRRGLRDRVDYVEWSKAGHIYTTPGNTIDTREIMAFATRLHNERAHINNLGFDRWGAIHTINDLSAEGITVTQIGQGYATLSAPAKELERLVLQKRIYHDGHPVMRWNISCSSVESDAAGNIKPTKPHRLQHSKRVDGVFALIDALAVAPMTEHSGAAFEDGVFELSL